ncbi:hypothetical protein [Streptomyces niveus]|uniref:hypothetical protein n=1 Tax=Streptomyces niveus TaxID=193462 RepID=UPI0013319BF7|nr:hypothetical protein [Streptomyces niveus]
MSLPVSPCFLSDLTASRIFTAAAVWVRAASAVACTAARIWEDSSSDARSYRICTLTEFSSEPISRDSATLAWEAASSSRLMWTGFLRSKCNSHPSGVSRETGDDGVVCHVHRTPIADNCSMCSGVSSAALVVDPRAEAVWVLSAVADGLIGATMTLTGEPDLAGTQILEEKSSAELLSHEDGGRTG